MNRLFDARSAAVVGVSTSASNLGRAIVCNLTEFQYGGYIYLVGPKGGAFLGHKIYTSVADLPEAVDLAAILVPATAVPEVLRQCGEKGIRRVVVESAGFGELHEDRVALEKEILDILARYQMRMIGPNCIGIINRHTGLAVPFMPFEAKAGPGGTAVVSQSGGVGAVMVNLLAGERIGFSKFASIGNKLNVNEADLLEYLIDDDKTDIIFCYLEGIADGRRLMEAAFRSPKAIVAHKSNTGGHGAVIARSHSASLSSDDQVVDAAFAQCGILRVREQQEALQALKSFMLPEMKGNRLAVISRSGGHAVMAADAAEEFGFQLPEFPPEVIRKVEERSRAKIIQFHNPLDLGDLFDMPLYYSLAEDTLARDDIDGLIFIHNYQGIFDAEESRQLVVGLGELARKSEKPLAICLFTTRSELDLSRKAVKLPIFTDPREAVRALAVNRRRHQVKPLGFSTDRPAGIDTYRVRKELEGIDPGPVPSATVAGVLAAYGIPLVEWTEAGSEDEAVMAARQLGFPVALKTVNPQVLHKSDVGGVYLNVADEAILRSAYRNLLKMGPSVLVQKMSESGLEWLIGGRQDRQFGPIVVVGLGGIYVEVFKQTGIRVAPITNEEAMRLLKESRGAGLLEGIRGQPPLDRRALVETIVRISWLLYDFPEIGELDLNPVRVFREGCMALDWRMAKGQAVPRT